MQKLNRLLLFFLFLISCQRTESVTVVVTEVVEVEGTREVITRLVEQTVTVPITTTPLPPIQLPVVLDLGMVGKFPNIDPQQTDSLEGIDLIENLFAGLTNYNHVTNTVEPELAKSWEVSENGRIWTFHLRDDIYWLKPATRSPPANELWAGEPVRPVIAADAVYAIQRACNRNTGTPDVLIFFFIEGCEAVYQVADPTPVQLATVGAVALDDVTLQITLREPASSFLTITSLWVFAPVPSELLQEFESDWQSAENLYTSGPFLLTPASVIEETADLNRAILHHNELWPIPLRGNVEIVNIAFLEDEEAILELWQDKAVDISPLPLVEDDLEDFIGENPENIALVSNQTTFYLAFNFNSPLFNNAAIRLAFSAAIDRQRLVAEIYGGQALPMRHLTPPGILGAPPINEVGVGYNPDLARQLIANSQYRDCKLIPAFTFLVSSLDLSLRQAELIRDMWVEELDCAKEQITIAQVQFGTLLANTRPDANNRPDLWELGWASFYPDAQNWLGDLLHCTQGENRQNRPCSEVDGLLAQAGTTMDTAERYDLYRQAENLFFNENGLIPLVPLYVRADYLAVQTWVQDYTPALFGGEQYDTYQVVADLKKLERER